MLKEHLKKHFKRIQTIKLKRHHYILGGFGIAAITILACIFGFQNIGTHAKDASTIDDKFIEANSNVSITETDFCDVLNTTGVNKNGTGEINIYCKLGECRETEVSKNILSGYNEKINITSDYSNTTCLVACQQLAEANDNCYEFDEDGKLKYDNVFTFTFEGISAGTSDIKLLENKITNSSGNGNTEVSGDMITVNEENEIIQVGCDFTGDTIKVNEGAGGEISLKCNIPNLPEFDNIRDAMKITTISGSDVIATGTSRRAERQEQSNTTYILSFTGKNAGEINITSNNLITLEDGGTKYKLNTKAPGQIEVDESATPTGPDCTVTAEPASVTRGQGGIITVQCTGEKVATGDIRNAIKTNEKVNVEGYPSEQTNIGDSNIKLVYQFTGAQVGTSYVLLLENRINSNGTRNGIVTGNDIEVVDTPTPTYCSIEAIPYSGYVNETGNIIVTCEGTKYYDLTSQGLIYSGNIITVSYESDRQEYNNKTTFTFKFTGEIPGRSQLKLLENAIGNAQNGSTSASFDTGITVNNPIPDCNTGWDNDYFITPEFRALNPTSGQIACALYGNNGEDETAYTMGWEDYKPGVTCSGFDEMKVVELTTLESTVLTENTIYVLTSTGFEMNDTIKLPKCSAIISNRTNGKDTTIEFTNSIDSDGIKINENYGILDNISLYKKDNNGNRDGINILSGSSNTLNVIKVYNRKENGISIERGHYNKLNNIQAFGNKNGGILIMNQSINNTISNSQIYANDEKGISIAYSYENIIQNVEVYENKTGINVYYGTGNTFEDIELYYNDTNIYILSGLQNNGYGNLQQYPKQYFFENSGELNDIERGTTKWKTEISGFNRVYSESEQMTRYEFKCEGGWTTGYRYTGSNPIDLTGEATQKCTEENRGEYLNEQIKEINRGEYEIKEIKPILEISEGNEPKYIGYQYPNYITNPRINNNTYYFERTSSTSHAITEKIKDYSYGYEINKQKDVKLGNSQNGGLVTGDYFIGSNVKKYEISGNIDKHTKVYYTITGTATDTGEIKKYNIYQIPQNIPSTIDWYTGSTRTKHTLINRNNQLTDIDINSGVEIYIETGDTSSYPVIVQMYGEGGTGPERNDYFAEHRYIGALNRQAPTFIIEPVYMCTNATGVNMTGTRTGFEYNMTGFDFNDIIVEGNAEKVENSFSAGSTTGVYTWQISLSGGIGTVTVNGNTSEDILEFGNAQSETGTYNRDIYAPEIETNGFTIPECTRKILDVEAQDVGCKGIKDYKLEGALGDRERQNSSIFLIEADTIGREGGTKTGLVYVRDGFDNTKTGIIEGTITDIQPTVTYGQQNPLQYEQEITNGTITVNNIISLLGASEGACGTDDLTIKNVSCTEGTATTGTNSITVTIAPGTTATTCTITIKDNEDTEVDGYISFTADDGYTVAKPKCKIEIEPTIIPKTYTGLITVTCSGTNRGELDDDKLEYSGNIITVGNTVRTTNATQTIYKMTYTGDREGYTDFGIKIGGISDGNVENDYIQGAGILVTDGTNIDCTRGEPDPTNILIWHTGSIGLDCGIDDTHGTLRNAILPLVTTVNEPEKIDFTGTSIGNITYTGIQIGKTHLYLSGNINEFLTVHAGESETINVYSGIYSGCTRGEPTYNPIAVGVEAYIDLICEDFEYHAENAHELWSVILYSGDTNAIETGTAQWLSDSGEGSGVRFIYTGENVGKIQLKASGDSNGYLYLTDEYSNVIHVIDYENNRPTCTITGTEMVTVGQTGTITVDCTNTYGILTTGITNDKLEYSGNIIVGDSIEEQPGTGQHKIFTFTFTGYIEGTGKIGLKTGAIKTVPGIENRYTEGNVITVVSGSNGIHICGWKDPNPDILTTGEAGYMKLDCILDDRIPGFLIKSGDDNSLSQTLTLDNESGPRVLHYTGDNEGTTQYAISGNIGNVHIQTRRDDMGEENIRSKEIRVTNNGIILYLNPQNKISNQDITVNMSGENAEWVKYYKTGTAGLEFDVCESRGTGLEQIGGQFNGTETISNNEDGITYIYLCGKLGSDSLMKVGTYTIDTSKPECRLGKDPTDWTNSGVTLFVSSITETNPKLYSWTGFNEGDMSTTTGTKTVYTTGTYNFYMKDAAGNTGICSTGVTNIDTQGPTGTVTYINGNGEAGNSCTTGSVTIILHTGNSISGYPESAFARNGTGDSNWTGNNTLTVTENESGTGYIRDNAGNILALPYNVTGIVNEGPTVPTLNSPTNGNTISSSNTEFNWIGSTGDNCAEISGYTMHIISGTETIRTGSTNATNITPNTGLQNGTYSRYVIATDNFGQTAQSQTRTFTINSDMPDCTIVYEPPYTPGFWTNMDVTGTLICTDPTVVEIITGTNVFTGNGYLPFSFKDLSNDNIWILTGHVDRIDKQAPGCNITGSAPSNGQVTLTLAFTGEEHPDLSGYSWDGITYGNNNETTVTIDGTYTGYVKDLAGNTGYCTKTVSNINTTAPEVSATNSSTTRKTGDIDITMYVTGINLSGARYITGTSTATFESCKENGTDYTNGTPITWSTEGTGYLTLCAYDNNGNTGYRTGIYKLDKSDPVCGTWSYNPPLTQLTSGTVTATLGGSTDNISGIRTGGGNCDITTFNGTCNVTISDNAGRTNTCTSSGATNIDTQKPTGEIITTYPSGHLTNGCTSGNVILTLSGSDVNGLHASPYKRDNEDWTTNPTKTLTNNTHGTGYIRDVAGNITAIPYNITGISHSGPSISLSRPDSGAILTGYVQFNWDASITDPVCQAISGGYNIVVYSGTNEIYTTNTNATNTGTTLPNGNYTWKVSITDILGHTIESEIRPFSINNQAPTCQVEYRPGSGTVTSGDVIATLTGCTPGTTGFNETGHTFTGNGRFVFTFENESGVSGNTTAIVNRIDKVPPVLHEVTPIGTTTDTTPNYTFSSTEPGRIEYSGACSSATTGAISGNNTITLNQLAYGTYSGCTITVTDAAGNKSDVLTISTFTIRQSGGGGGGGGLQKDYCPDGDYSDSYYDRTCEGPIDICGVSTSKFNTEMKTAYLYAYQHGMTTICPIDDADLYGFIRRDQLAKMLTQYAINVLDLEPQAGKSGCTAYNDIANSSAEMKYYMKTACELDIMGLESDGKTPMKSFYPHGLVSRAEFGTTLSRLIYGDAYNLESEAENTYPGAWYGKHLEALKRDEIMTQIYGDRPQHLELRGYVMLMLMRHGKARLDNVKNIPYSTPEEIMDIYSKNKALTCEMSYYESEDDYGSGMLYVKDNKLRENLKIHNEGNISSLIKNDKLYVRGDAIGSGMGMVADAEATALEELEALLEDDAYSFKNCNEAVKNINAFEVPSNIRFKSIGDWFTELANSFTSIFE